LFLECIMNTQNKVVISGGSGLVGKRLTTILESMGYEVSHLSRSTGKTQKTYLWNPSKGLIDSAVFTENDYIIHLAGAGVADRRWTSAYKKEIYDSRIFSTRLLVSKMGAIKDHTIKKFISASAIGIYGNDVPMPANENTTTANTFLAKVCVDWEQEAIKAQHTGVPTTIIRVGVVLAREGGFIPQISAPIKLFAGTVLGSGKQLLSWIHIDDLCAMFADAIKDDTLTGVFNAVAPAPISHHDITYKMAKLLGKRIILPNTPVFMLKLMLGEMYSMILANQNVSAQKWIDRGFKFTYAHVDEALTNLIP
jgi:uncharacterized protein (TIGR01777 family)